MDECNRLQKQTTVVSEYFTEEQNNDSLQDFKETKKVKKPSKPAKTTRKQTNKPIKKIKGQKSIKTAFKSSLISYATQFRNACLDNGIDVDSEELQIAIALSKSEQEIKHPEQQISSTHSKQKSTRSISNTQKIRTTLREYGFTVPEVKQNQGKKTRRKSYKNSLVINCTVEEKKQRVSDKISEIVVNISSSCNNNTVENHKENRFGLQGENYENIRDNTVFYVSNIVEVGPNTVGSLLKDWSKIPGRPLSPNLNIDYIDIFEFVKKQDDLDVLLSGTILAVNNLITILKGDKTPITVEKSFERKDSKLAMTDYEIRDTSKDKKARYSPDLFEDESYSFEKNTNFEVQAQEKFAFNINNDEISIDKSQIICRSNNDSRSISVDENHLIDLTDPTDKEKLRNEKILDLECQDLTQSSNSSEESLPFVSLSNKNSSTDLLRSTEVVNNLSGDRNIEDIEILSEDNEEVRNINFKASNTNKEHNDYEIDLTQEIPNANNENLSLFNHSSRKQDILCEQIDLNLTDKINKNNESLNSSEDSEICSINFPETKFDDGIDDKRKSLNTRNVESQQYYDLTGMDTSEVEHRNNDTFTRINAISDEKSVPYSLEEEASCMITSSPEEKNSRNSENHAEANTSNKDSFLTNQMSFNASNDYDINYDENIDLTQSSNDSIQNDKEVLAENINNTTASRKLSFDDDKFENDKTVEYSNYSKVNFNLSNNDPEYKSPNVSINNITINNSDKLQINSNIQFNDGILSQCPNSFEISDDELDYSMQYYKKHKRKSTTENSICPINPSTPSTSKCFTPKSILRRSKSLNFDGSLPAVEIKGTKVNVLSPPAKSSPCTPVKLKPDYSTVVTPGNSEYIVKYKDVTPMADLNKMETPEVNKELDKYGIKPFKRKRAIQLLEYIYYQTHPIVESIETDAEVTPKKRKIQGSPESIARDNANTSSENIYAVTNNAPVIKNIECDESEWIFQKREKAKLHGCRVPLHIAFHNYVHARPQLMEKILKYEPVSIDLVHKELANDGYKYDPKELLRYMDKKCITVKTAESEKNGKKTKKRY